MGRPRYKPIPKWSLIFIKVAFRPFYEHFYLQRNKHDENHDDHEQESYFNSADINEWQLLAESADKLFLIVFIFLSLSFTFMTIILLKPTLDWAACAHLLALLVIN